MNPPLKFSIHSPTRFPLAINFFPLDIFRVGIYRDRQSKMHILNLYKPSPGLLWKCCGPSDLRSYSSGLIQISTSTAHGLVSRKITAMSASVTKGSGISIKSMAIQPPSHPTYDLRGIIKLALAEDSADFGDVTSLATIPSDIVVDAFFLAKEDGTVAGIALADMVFQEVDPSIRVEWSQKDGDYIHKGLQFGKVSGQARSILIAERVALNFMQRMSGIATLTKAMADAASPARILETRKTAPGLRLVDKWAVLIGGGQNHRMGLFDMVLIKDNHISAAGSIINAIKSVDLYLQQRNLKMDVEVETRTLEEVHEVLHYATQKKTSLTRMMLDNMVVPLPNGDVDVAMLKEAVDIINGRFETEASGNVTLHTVQKIGQTGVTYISSGALTHSVKALDISLKIDTELALQVGRRTKRA
ncbi:nicotinate-nucleotide pyrophosphorylase [carboxylating], chloroplastic isoform X1 [Momordica charantia]|uniref:nicotinate-nucleotide diphosphorylase (carboxylating) n=3 Tax=Momordica charantia TaxID=3673 RepID=A0A6J1DQ18_MOMCH|nr:nicotinate-nucleotide pyrophosphorylase [carboxylating], chloroplastic isoform X1 [Momordica charantia]